MLTNYRVLIVPGFMSSCFRMHCFSGGQQHHKQGVAVGLLPVSMTELKKMLD
jgi:hypothetical protein